MEPRYTAFIVFSAALFLISCTTDSETLKDPEPGEAQVAIEVSGAKSSVFATLLTTSLTQDLTQTHRPSSPLGMYIALLLTQERMFPALSALEGVDVQVKLIRSEQSIERDETFALLEEYGSVLQVDITDALNRSTDREKTLDQYLSSLKRMNERMSEKEGELKQRLDAAEDERREQSKKVKEVERTIRNALKDKDYAAAGPKQKELTGLEGKLAAIETKEKQLKKVLKVYRSLIEVGTEREEAISKNRELLLAGLKVIDVPGLEDLGIVIEE